MTTDGEPRAYEGRAKTNPSTLHMDGTSPVTVYIQATTDELREMHNKTVRLDVLPADGPDPDRVLDLVREALYDHPAKTHTVNEQARAILDALAAGGVRL